MNNDPRSFGGRLRLARKAIGKTQTQLGELLSLEKQTISSWENNGNQPSVSMLERLCKETGQDANYFVLGSQPAIPLDAMEVALAFAALDDRDKPMIRRALGLASEADPKKGAMPQKRTANGGH